MIPDLPAAYVRHLVEPHGLGDLDAAHAVGQVGSMVGGLGVRVSLTYEAGENGHSRITAAAGRPFGSAAPLAPLSWLAETVEGTIWEMAAEHGEQAVLEALGHRDGAMLPEPVVRGARFAVLALRRALGVAGCGPPADPTGDGILVCRCLGVGDHTIRRAIRDGAHDPEAVGAATRACTGCRSCRPDVLALIDDELRSPPPTPPENLHPVARIALARVGPVLRALGMPLEGVEVRDGGVHLGLGTPAPEASISHPGALAVGRHVLREIVDPDVRVTA